MTSRNDSTTLLRILECSFNRLEDELLEVLHLIGPESLGKILYSVDSVSDAEISQYAVRNFDALDMRPNLVDQMISRHEIVEALEKSVDTHEQTILVAMWLRFDEIRQAHQDFSGTEAAFDTQISYTDFQKFGAGC